jgi:putative restriction endonuclease
LKFTRLHDLSQLRFGELYVTDYDWFTFLAAQPDLDEVNFWRPSDTRVPRQLHPGIPVLFKLREKYGGWIVGWAPFARHDVMPAWLAWEAFGPKNGAADFDQMRQRIEALRPENARSDAGGDYEIGCLMLSSPIFFSRDHWVSPPADWPKNAVQGKLYDLTKGEGKRVWDECEARTSSIGSIDSSERAGRSEKRYAEPTLTRARYGQGTFRIAVTGAYSRACAVTGEHSLPALEAAHIRPYGEGGEHEVSNGLLLRSDIHRLFDKGYVGVTPEYRFIVSDRLRGDYSNGRSYYPLASRVIELPALAEERPSREWLEWHMDTKFRR